jgi:hypothetical protein
MERLAVLVPPPRFHLVRYHGILAPAAGWRDIVVPPRPGPCDDLDSVNSRPADSAAPGERSTRREAAEKPHAGRLPWAHLLARVFAVDALKCPRCGEAMRVLAAIQSPDAIRDILECLGLPARPPPVAPAALGGLLPADL